jgi:ubiquitin-like protein ATG12
VYLREAFTPSLDDELSVLKQAYGIDGKLHVNYALTPAWG